MPLAFKDNPLTKQSFKLSPFVSEILIKNATPVSKTCASYNSARQITDKKENLLHKENVHISTNKMFL